MGRSIELSVVVVVLEGGAGLERCLRALHLQAATSSIEVLVPWDTTRGAIPNLPGLEGTVRFQLVEGPCTYAELRAQGIRQSSGEIVALTEDHCLPDADWCSRIISAHRSNHAAIGGAVQKEVPDTALNWSFYFADYVRYLDPREGPSDHLTDCNVTYKRGALNAISTLWNDEFHENTIHAALKVRNESLWLTPQIVVRQRRRFNLKTALWDRYAFGRLFGSTRSMTANLRLRATLIAVAPALPVLLVIRAASHVLRTGRYKGEFLRALPSLTLLSLTWAWGEFVGYLTGRPETVLASKTATNAVHSSHRPIF